MVKNFRLKAEIFQVGFKKQALTICCLEWKKGNLNIKTHMDYK